MRATATTTSGEEPALLGWLSQAHIQGHGGGGGRLLEGRGEKGFRITSGPTSSQAGGMG